jgi:hypothetical protein
MRMAVIVERLVEMWSKVGVREGQREECLLDGNILA